MAFLTFTDASWYICYFNAASHNDWIGRDDASLFCGRSGEDGGGPFYFAKLSFSTKELNFLVSESLILKVTATNKNMTSNFGRISAILSERELTGSEVYEIVSEQTLMSTDGVLTYANCKEAVDEDYRVSAGTEVSFEFNTSRIDSNKNYYIYLKRKIGLANLQVTPGTGGFSYIGNPITYPNLASIELITKAEPTWPSATEVTINPDHLSLDPEAVHTQEFSLIKLDSNNPLTWDDAPVTWSFEAFNKEGQAIDPTWVSKVDGSENKFLFNKMPEGSNVKIKASWGSQSATYEKIAVVDTFIKWKQLNQWVIGYNMALLGLPPINMVRKHIANDYNGHILPLLPQNSGLQDENFIAISRDDIAMTTYRVYIATQPFRYIATDEQCLPSEDETQILVSVYKKDEDTTWRDPQIINEINTVSFTPLWVNVDLKDSYDNILFPTYEPKKVYG